MVVILLVNTPLEHDFKTMFEAASAINRGAFDVIKTSDYFQLFGYQLGHTLYMSFFLKIFKSAFFLYVLNGLFSSGIVLLIYLIGKDFVKEKTAMAFSLLYSLFPFPLLLNTVLTNQHHSTFFFLLAIYFLLHLKQEKESWWKKGILVGTCLGISHILRPEGMVFFVAFLVYLLFSLTKKNKKQLLLMGSTVILCFLVLTSLASFGIKSLGLNPNGLRNNDPYWKFIVGLNATTNGAYSENDQKLYTFGNTKQALELIRNRTLGNMTQLPLLFLKKEVILFTKSDLSWSIGYFQQSGKAELYQFLTNLNQCFIYFFLIFAILGCFVKQKKKESLFLILLIGVYFGVYLLIEVMPRYAYSIQPILLILGMIGWDSLREWKKKGLQK